MCVSIIDNYLNWQNTYEFLSLGKFASYYNIRNKIFYKDATNEKSLGL